MNHEQGTSNGERFADGRPKVPSDVVLGKGEGVTIISAHLAEEVGATSEVVRLRDMFGHQCLRGKKYTAGQIDSRRTDEIERDFSQWMSANMDQLPVPPEQIKKLLKILEWQIYFHTNPMFKEIVTYDEPMIVDGYIPLSDKPGVGVEINEEGLKKYADKNVPFFI